MAQFDVFSNPGRQRAAVPTVVALQNARYDRAATRLVAALVLQASIRIEAHWLAPGFTIAGQAVVLDVFNLATVPVSRLGSAVASLADEDSRMKRVRALVIPPWRWPDRAEPARVRGGAGLAPR